jgi:hypothetical protein
LYTKASTKLMQRLIERKKHCDFVLNGEETVG